MREHWRLSFFLSIFFNDIIFSMPLLIRLIAQRLAVFVFAILSFFGVNPDLSVPAPQAIEERKQEQQERISEILSVSDASTTQEQKTEIIQDVEEKIGEIQKEFTQTITNPVVEKAKDIIPTDLVYEQAEKKFDVRDVVVNIICLEKTNSYTRLSTGSGVIISESGLILTNAHVAYPFLHSSQFNKDTYSCSVRRENIPNFGYEAEVVYYPVDWLKENKEIIKDPSPVGTGEDDYSLLYITKGIGPTRIGNFSYATTNINSTDLQRGLSVIAAGYPSISSGVFEVDTKPGLKVADTSIVDFFTFGTRSFDVLQTGNNVVAKRGSSGGGIFENNNLYGIVVTTNTNSAGSYINALTIPYIKNDFEEDTGVSFESFISYPLSSMRGMFNVQYKNSLIEIISEN